MVKKYLGSWNNVIHKSTSLKTQNYQFHHSVCFMPLVFNPIALNFTLPESKPKDKFVFVDTQPGA